MEKTKSSTKRVGTALSVTLIIAVSKVIGMVRDMIFVATFGSTLETTAYYSANKLLSGINLIFTVGIASTFVPIYTRTRLRYGFKHANNYANYILNLYIIVGVIAGICGYFFAPQISALLWKSEETAAQAVPLIAQYSQMMLPMTVFWAISGVFCNILNANERFVPEQLMGFALSAAVIGACVFGGTVSSVARMNGLTGLLQVLILLPFLRGCFSYKLKLGINSSRVRRTFKLALPAMISMAFDDINSMADSYFASGIDVASGTHLTNSYRLVMLVLGVLSVPLLTMTFPRLSACVARNDKKGLLDSIKQSIEILAIVLLPISVLMALFSTEIVGIIYQRGAFTQSDTIEVSMALLPYILGVFGFSLRNFQTRVFYSMQETKAPMFIGIGAVALNIALDALLYQKMGVSGLTMATSISAFCSAITMMIVLRKRLGHMGMRSTFGQLIRVLIATAICFAVAWWCKKYFPMQGDGTVERMVRFAVGGMTGLIAYFASVQILKVNEVVSISKMLRSKFRK